MEIKQKTKKKKSPVNKPHDKLVRRLLSTTGTFRDLLEAYLPAEVKNLVDLDSLEREPDTFVDAQHRLLEVDILFKAPCKKTSDDCFIWVLIEQQRDPDVWLPLRTFCYIGVVWDHIRKNSGSRAKSNKLPFIYPLIISNASKAYTYPLSLRDLIEPKEARVLFDTLFKTPIQLIDLAAIPDEDLREKLQSRVRAQALLLSLKHVFDKDLPQYLETVLSTTFQTLEKEGYREEVIDMLYYLYNEGNLADSIQFLAFLRKFPQEIGEEIMGLGQLAVQQAVQHTRQQTLENTAVQMLKKKLDLQLISEVTGLAKEEIRQLAPTTSNFETV